MSDGKIPAFRNEYVHVGVLCPPQAAVTLLLNAMSQHGGAFVLMQGVPMQQSRFALHNGNQPAQVVVFSLLIFSIRKSEWESWLSISYDPNTAFNMGDVLAGKVPQNSKLLKEDEP